MRAISRDTDGTGEYQRLAMAVIVNLFDDLGVACRLAERLPRRREISRPMGSSMRMIYRGICEDIEFVESERLAGWLACFPAVDTDRVREKYLATAKPTKRTLYEHMSRLDLFRYSIPTIESPRMCG